MQTLCTIGLTGLLTGCGLASSAPAEQPVERPAHLSDEVAAAPGQRQDVDLATFAARLAKGATVIDVRTSAEFAGGHVPGARHAPLDALTPDHPAIADLPKDQPVYVICETGRRSSKAADQLAAAGYHTINVEGGTRAWIASGHPVE